MALRKHVRSNYGRKLTVSIKYENLHSFKEGVILLCQSILETRRISNLHGSALFTIPLRCYTCIFIRIATSTGINKATTHQNNCLPCAFGTGGSRTLAAFKMELFVTKVNGYKLLILLQRVHVKCGGGPRSACEKHR